MAITKKPTKATKTPKAVNLKFTIDCSAPVKDSVFDLAAFEKYLHDRIKVGGITGNLGSNVKIVRSNDGKIIVTSKLAFSKRYLKYLTKKFLKKHNLRDWLRVIADDKQSFVLRYYNIATQDNEDEEDME